MNKLPRHIISIQGNTNAMPEFRHFWFRIRASNGKMIDHGQTYKSKQSCAKGLRSLLKNLRSEYAGLTLKEMININLVKDNLI